MCSSDLPVHATGVLTRGNFRVNSDDVIPGFRAITDAVHAEGAAIIQQLYHVGQHGDFDNSFQPSWSPSGMPSYHDPEGSHAMTEAEIDEIITGFVESAVRAQQCGFDGVELFAAYHAIIDQFWLPWSNRRTDQWGGSLENRLRFGAEIMRRIRAAVGDRFVIGLAVSVDAVSEVAMSIDDLCEVVAWYDQHQLIDYVTCGTGSYFDFDKIIPTFQQPDKLGVEYAERLSAVVTHARVQAESHVRTPENADYVIASKQADMVSVVRGQIADPHLVEKALTGRADQIRGCISCNQMCWGRRFRDYWISCLVNPSTGREWEWGGDSFTPTDTPKKVLVVGGGPGGLETARVAAERGHRVTLVEAGPQLGGAFRLAGLQPRRSQITELVEWYERELQRLDVHVKLNSPMDADEVREFGADEVVMATGSQPSATGFQRFLPLVERMPGVDRPNVGSIDDVLDNRLRVGKRVVLVDEFGDWRGGGTAWHLAEKGHDVVVVTSQPKVGQTVERTSGDLQLRGSLARLGTTWHTESVVTEWTGEAAIVRNLLDGSEHTVPADTLVLALLNTPEDAVLRDLRAASDGNPSLHAVGDVVAARTAVQAIYEGRVTGMRL